MWLYQGVGDCDIYVKISEIGVIKFYVINSHILQKHYAKLVSWSISWAYATPATLTRMPSFGGYPPPPHDYPYYWVILDPKSKEDNVKVTNLRICQNINFFKFQHKLYTRHTFWSCLIRCANMKCIWPVRYRADMILSTDRQMDGRTDGQGKTSIPPFQLRWSGGYKKPCAS